MALATNELLNYVENHMESFKCPTHDMAHCLRVANLSYKIAKECSDCGDFRIAYLGGLVHDVLDSKLITTIYNKELIENELRSILLNKEKCSNEQVDIVINITKSVGYSKRLKMDYHSNQHLFSKEYKAVQDADLLDAIGCIGIARCFTYGGKRCNPIFGVSDSACEHITYDYYINSREEQNTTSTTRSMIRSNSTNSSTEHFFEKLLRIKSLLITPLGQQMGYKRHSNMIQFLILLRDELKDGVEDVLNLNNNILKISDSGDSESSADQPIKKQRVGVSRRGDKGNHMDNMDKIEMFI